MQSRAELGLAKQKRLQQRMIAELEVRQHSQLFECGHREVLRFVHYEQAASSRAGLLVEKPFDRTQRTGLVMAVHFEPEALCDDVDDLLVIELAGDDLSHRQPLRIQCAHQMGDQR